MKKGYSNKTSPPWLCASPPRNDGTLRAPPSRRGRGYIAIDYFVSIRSPVRPPPGADKEFPAVCVDFGGFSPAKLTSFFFLFIDPCHSAIPILSIYFFMICEWLMDY